MTATRLSLRSRRGIVVVVLLHAALLWLATRPLHVLRSPDQRVWLALLPPRLQVLDAAPATAPARVPTKPPAIILPRAAVTSRRAQEPPPVEAPATPAPTPTQRSAEESALMNVPSMPPAPASPLTGDVAARALKSVGAIDKQLRAELAQKPAPPLTAPNARLIKGLAAAHAAVGPKWFEQARSELISAPNDPNRIYRITTALREYCLFYPNKSSIAANSDTRGGAANFGQPTMADCPTPF